MLQNRLGGTFFKLRLQLDRVRVDPFAYLRDVLTRFAPTPINDLDQFLPDRWTNREISAVETAAASA